VSATILSGGRSEPRAGAGRGLHDDRKRFPVLMFLFPPAIAEPEPWRALTVAHGAQAPACPADASLTRG
jgi:hypothetical protein